MTHYRSNVADVRFNLFEVFGRDHVLGTGPWEDLDAETASEMLLAGAELAENELSAPFRDDQWEVDFDPATGNATLPEAFKKAYDAYVSAEWWRMDIEPELGGIAAPPSLRWAMYEFSLGASTPIVFYAEGWMTAQVLADNGTDAQKRIAQIMVDRAWGGTMVLTEPDAGSAVGSGKTRAIPQPDGTWHIEGIKRFITSADHNLAENIIHFVLARPVDTPGAGGPGTKGLSLFLVPKYHFDFETGELGERNGAFVTGIEKKMGLKASTTCEVTFSQKIPAVGYLVGDVHSGIAQMFRIVEYARMLVGVKATATLSSAYLNALDYAKTRVQSPDLARRGERGAPDVPIITHPDVRRSLMTQKAYAEGMRALMTFAACTLDEIRLAEYEGVDVADLHARNNLILPIVKGFCSEQGYAKLADALQVFGGSGYLKEYPLEQYIRDSKIDSIYEGTTAIQGIDLFFRKLRRDGGKAVNSLFADIESGISEARGSNRLGDLADPLSRAVGDVQDAVAILNMKADAAEEAPEAIYEVGLQTTRLLMMFGELLLGWLLVRQGIVAERKLQSGGGESQAFYEGKVATARYFVSEHLPKVALDAQLIRSGVAMDIMALSDEAF